MESKYDLVIIYATNDAKADVTDLEILIPEFFFTL